jgi:transcription antitermination factor NusG
MYSIFAAPRVLKLVKKVLEDKGYVIRDTKLKEYILVRRDPVKHLPEKIRKFVRVSRFDGDYFDFLKDANIIRDILAPKKIEAGDPVVIIDGPYKDFKGIVKERRNKDLYMVDISIWGKIVTADVEAGHIEKKVIKI